MISSKHFLILLVFTVAFAVAIDTSTTEALQTDLAVEAPRSPADVPEEEPVTSGRHTGQRILYGVVLFFISIPVLALEMYSIYDPEEAYLLFRRHLKYQGDVELTEFYRQLTRYGSVFGLILYSLLLVVSGYTLVLLLTLLAIGFLYLSMELNSTA